MRPYIIFFIAFISITAIMSCKKETDKTLNENYELSNKATLQWFIATVGARLNFIYIDGAQANGDTLRTGNLFPSPFAKGFTLDDGTRTISIKDTSLTTTQVPLNAQQDFSGGKRYFVFTYDTITSPQIKFVETNLVVPDDTTARLRIANFLYSRESIPKFDVFSERLNTNIFTNLDTAQVTDFVPFPSSSNEKLIFREAGTTTEIFSVSNINLIPKRSYTIVQKGNYLIFAPTRDPNRQTSETIAHLPD